MQFWPPEGVQHEINMCNCNGNNAIIQLPWGKTCGGFVEKSCIKVYNNDDNNNTVVYSLCIVVLGDHSENEV